MPKSSLENQVVQGIRSDTRDLTIYYDLTSHVLFSTVCNYGSYTSGVWCIKCPKGTYSDELGLMVTCKPCPASTSTLEEGSTSMEQCLNVSLSFLTQFFSFTCRGRDSYTPCYSRYRHGSMM